MKTWHKVLLAGGAVALISTGLLRTLEKREQRGKDLAAQTAAQRTEVKLQVSTQDLLVAEAMTLQQTLAITAVVAPSRSAVVKARLPGELIDLTLREGDAVKAGDVIARTDDTQARTNARVALEQLNSARAQLDIVQRTFDNNRALAKQGFISETAVQNAVASLDAAKASLASAQAAVALSEANLQDTVLKAPINGLVAHKFAQTGELLGAGSPVVEIVDPSQIELESSVQTAKAGQLRIGQSALIQDPASPRSYWQARVVRINPKAEASSRTVKFYLRISDRPALYPGQFLQGQLQVGQTKGLGLPLTAIRTDAPKPFVQVVRQQRVAHQTVTINSHGDRDGATYAIVDGIEAGEQVLAGSLGPIRIGTPVLVQARNAN